MPLGVEVRTRTAPPTRGAPTDTGTLFVAGTSTAGPLDKATLVRSVADFEAAYTNRAGAPVLWDYLDVFFREGGSRAYVGRYTTGAGGSLLAGGLGLFTKGLGPGQVAAPGETPGATTYGALLDHAAANNRFALLDVANNDTVAAMTTLAGAIPTANESYGALFAPWVNVPGPADVVGAGARQVHATAVIAALCTRVDALGNPNRAAAGRDFPLQYVTSFVRNISDADRNSLLDAGANTFAEVYGVLENYGFQTGIAQSDATPFWQANASRARMWITARAQSIGENYMFKPIDGRGLLARSLKSDLDAILLELYQANGLYGETPADAFATDVSAVINTTATVAQGELRAVAEARLSLHAKRILIDLVSIPVTGRVSTAA